MRSCSIHTSAIVVSRFSLLFRGISISALRETREKGCETLWVCMLSQCTHINRQDLFIIRNTPQILQHDHLAHENDVSEDGWHMFRPQHTVYRQCHERLEFRQGCSGLLGNASNCMLSISGLGREPGHVGCVRLRAPRKEKKLQVLSLSDSFREGTTAKKDSQHC